MESKEKLNKPQFRTMWSNPFEVVAQDLSNEFEETFEEIPPYTKDEKGNWLNDTSVPKLVSKGKINVQERIQSFADDVDIYKILENFAYSGDESLLNRRPCLTSDVDVSNIPTDLNSFNEYFNKFRSDLSNINSDLAKMILSDEATVSQIEEKAKMIYNERIDKYNQSRQDKNIEVKESEK